MSAALQSQKGRGTELLHAQAMGTGLLLLCLQYILQRETLTGLGSSGFHGWGVDSYPQLRVGTQPELVQRVWFETFHSIRGGWVKLHFLLQNEGKTQIIWCRWRRNKS